MLQAISDRAKGWLATVIVFILIIPFALWGVHEYFGGGGGEVTVAEVNGEPITLRTLDKQVNDYLDQFPQRPSDDQLQFFRLNVLDRLIQDKLLYDAAKEAGLRISEGQLWRMVRAAPNFQQDGEFSEEIFLQWLRFRDMNVAGFQEQESRDMVRAQLQRGLISTEFVSKTELEDAIRLQDSTRELSYVVVPKERFSAQVTISDEQIKQYYESNLDRFMTPEQVKLAYVRLDVKKLKESVKLTEDDIRAHYEETKGDYGVAEQREGAHILVAVAEDADDAAVQAAEQKAQALYQRLQKGEDFATLAKSESDDAGSALSGGELGVLEPGVFSDAFDEAVAGLAADEISQPVRSPYGFHIVKVLGVKPAGEKTFEQARAQVEDSLRLRRAEHLYYEQSETLRDHTYQNRGTLEVAAREMGLKIQETAWLTRQGGSGPVAGDPQVIEAAFSDEVLAGGDLNNAANSDLIELSTPSPDSGGLPTAVVVRVIAHQPAKQKPLDEVKQAIGKQLRDQALAAEAQKFADNLVQRLRAGEAMAPLAEAEKLTFTEAGWIGRRDNKHKPALVQAAFTLSPPAAGGRGFGVTRLGSGDYAVLAVGAIKPGDPAAKAEAERKFLTQTQLRMQQEGVMRGLLGALSAGADVMKYPDRLRADEE